MENRKNKLSHKVEFYPFYKKINGKEFIFIHIPKTGGTSINRVLKFPKPRHTPGVRKHNRLMKIKPLFTENAWKNAYKFCFVRNPWDRVYSHYRFRHRKRKFKKEKHYDSFEKWLFYEFYEAKDNPNLIPQTKWIEDTNGVIDLNFIGQFENLTQDFQKICEINNWQLTLPHFNKTVLSYDYRTRFNNEMIDLVAESYKADIVFFNYSF